MKTYYDVRFRVDLVVLFLVVVLAGVLVTLWIIRPEETKPAADCLPDGEFCIRSWEYVTCDGMGFVHYHQATVCAEGACYLFPEWAARKNRCLEGLPDGKPTGGQEGPR